MFAIAFSMTLNNRIQGVKDSRTPSQMLSTSLPAVFSGRSIPILDCFNLKIESELNSIPKLYDRRLLSVFRRHWRSIFILVASLIIIFVISGYLLSDDLFFSELISKNRIATPEEAFAFVLDNTYPATDEMKLVFGRTPRYLLTQQKFLFCDHGAILLATIVHKLGYQTRLVDLIEDDNISHHTILEVYQSGTWKTYDTMQKLQGATYKNLLYTPIMGYYNRIIRPVYRAYPRFYNWVIQNNFYMKHLSLWLRGFPG